MEDNIIKAIYTDAINDIKSIREEKDRMADLYGSASVMEIESAYKKRNRMTKAVVAALAFACILVLGGGAVWAMNTPAIRDYFFSNSEEEFAEIYIPAGNEYIFGNHKLIYEGSIYEKAIETGYIHFSLWDKNGNPVECYKNGKTNITNPVFHRDFRLRVYNLNYDGDEAYIVFINPQFSFSLLDGNNLYLKFSRTDPDRIDYPEEKGIEFAVMNSKEWKEFSSEYTELLDNGGYSVSSPYEILDKYNACYVENSTTPPQVIEVEGVKMTIGRMDIVLDYNLNECPFDEFIMRLEDGTEIKFSKFEVNDHEGYWDVTVNGNKNTFMNTLSGSAETDGTYKVSLNFGCILGADEKVSIEVNGETYR